MPPADADIPCRHQLRARRRHRHRTRTATRRRSQADDFEVTEDGKPQTVETFKLVKLDGGLMPTTDGPPQPIRTDEDEQREAAKDDVRLFAIFLDDYHVRSGASMAARDSDLAVRRDAARAVGHDRRDVSAAAGRRRSA